MTCKSSELIAQTTETEINDETFDVLDSGVEGYTYGIRAEREGSFSECSVPVWGKTASPASAPALSSSQGEFEDKIRIRWVVDEIQSYHGIRIYRSVRKPAHCSQMDHLVDIPVSYTHLTLPTR